MTSKESAVVTAGIRLERLELWARRTFYATVVLTAMMAVIASVGAYGACEYLRFKWALAEIGKGRSEKPGSLSIKPVSHRVETRSR